MSRDAGTCSAAATAITKRELDSRVDERIRKFMSDADVRGMSSRMEHGLGRRCDDWDYPSMRSRALLPASDVGERVRALRRNMAAGDELYRRSERLRAAAEEESLRRAERLRAAAEEESLRRSERLRAAAEEESLRRSERLRAAVQEEPYRRSERLSASSHDDNAAVRARLSGLRRECEAAAEESRRRHMAASAAGVGGGKRGQSVADLVDF